MKRLLILLLALLFASPCQAWTVKKMDGVTVSGGASIQTDSCTSGLLFSWHAENADVTLGGAAGGVNNGCSVGDSVGAPTASGATIETSPYQDGTHSALVTGTSKNYQFDISSNDIIKDTGTDHASTVEFYVYLNTFVDAANFFLIYFDRNRSNHCHVFG